MGVCLEKDCTLFKEKVKDGINIEINEKNKIDIKYNQEEENQNNLEESELTKKDKQIVNNQNNQNNQNNINNENNQNDINNSKTTNGYIIYKIQSKFKSKVVRCSNNGHLSSNSVNIYDENNNKNKDKNDKLIYFTNFNDKNNNNSSAIINTKTK